MFAPGRIPPPRQLTLELTSVIMLGMAEKSEETQDVYTSAELAKRWRVTPRTVTNWCNEGEFPHAKKLGSSKNAIWRIPRQDVIAFEQRRKLTE